MGRGPSSSRRASTCGSATRSGSSTTTARPRSTCATRRAPDRGGRDRRATSRSSSTPASSRSAARWSRSRCPTTSWRGSRASRALGATRPDRPRHGRLLRPGLPGHADARDRQPHPGPDQALRRPADRAALVHGPRRAGRAAVRHAGAGLALPGPGRGHRVPLHAVASAPVLHALITVRPGARRGGVVQDGVLRRRLRAAGVRRDHLGDRHPRATTPSRASKGARDGVMLLAAVLVAATMASAVLTG